MARTQATDFGAFRGFGTSALPEAARAASRGLSLPDGDADARRALRDACPTQPGVYGWLSPDRQLLYVGKSKSLRHRLVSYCANQPVDPKMSRIRRSAAHVVWEPWSDELLALLREQELICRFRPEFNTQGQPHRRQPAFVAISRSAAPHAQVVRQLHADTSLAFGPIMGTHDARQSVAALNHHFRLRDCSDKTPFEFGGQGRLFSDDLRAQCLRYELGTCPGPCAGLCRKSAYEDNLAQAVAFLEGRDRSCLAALAERMAQAAQRQQFERAALLRDRWESLQRLDRQLDRLRRAEQTINGVRPVPTARGGDHWLIFRHGRLVGALPAPRTSAQRGTAARELHRCQALARQWPLSILEVNWQLIIGSWFRRRASGTQELISFESLRAENGRAIGASPTPHQPTRQAS